MKRHSSGNTKDNDEEVVNTNKKFASAKFKRYFAQEETCDEESKTKLQYTPNSGKKNFSNDNNRTYNNDFKEIVTVAKLKQRFKGKDAAKSKVAIPKEKIMRYSRGESVDVKGVRGKIHKKRLERKEQLIEYSTEQAARSELLLTEESGYLVADEGEETYAVTQSEIVAKVDITSAAKRFELQLREFGPYRMNYTRNGRYLLLGGHKGHVAAMDWITKRLMCEINVMETVHDVSYLHTETMFGVAQKGWVYIYDNKGVELHCLKQLYRITRLEFLPYHFLLAACSDNGYLSWLDVSIGKMVANFCTRHGRLNIMAQNPQNALMCLGHSKGTVTMWSPNSRDPLVTMLCHKAPLTALAVHPTGNYLATAASDRTVNIWDLRNFAPVQKYRLKYAASDLSFSQKGMLAAGFGNVVEVFKDCVTSSVDKPYMSHNPRGAISQIAFCPYEDILGVSTRVGFESLLIPGSGEANFDALESNPYQSKKQRQEAEVKALLEKIQPELITLNPAAITEVDVPTLKEKIEAKQKLKYVKPPKVVWDKKRKGKGGPSAAAKTRRKLQEQSDRAFREKIKDLESKLSDGEEEEKAKVEEKKEEEPAHVLDRFRPKKKK